jgi:hypothetical protein
VVPRLGRRRGRVGFRRGRGRKRSGTGQGAIRNSAREVGGRGCGRDDAGDRPRWCQAAAAVESVTPERSRLVLDHKRLEELRWCRRNSAVHPRGNRASQEGELAVRLQWQPTAAL